MKILFFDAGSYTYWDILAAFKEMGHSCKTVYYHFKDRYEDAFFEERMEQYLQRERCEILKRANSRFDTHLYTYTSALEEGMPANYGPLKYYEEMPFVFRNSKLNLNITLKDIRSGIPLRALDIMGSRGVLLSNYQPELAEMFEDGKDVILYESVEDVVEKMDFYLKREDLRERIAKSGYRKVCEHFSYRERLMQMLQ